MSKEPAEFEVLLKHVDRAGTRAVDGNEEDAPVAPKEKRLMKPEVMSPQGNPRHRSEPPRSRLPVLLSGPCLSVAFC